MPTISMFYGILIRMFFRDTEKHHVPHIHADHQGKVAVYSIPDVTLLAGGLRPLQRLVGRHARLDAILFHKSSIVLSKCS
jgi:hypothetical protein